MKEATQQSRKSKKISLTVKIAGGMTMFSLLIVLFMGSVVMIRVGSALAGLPAAELARTQSDLITMMGLGALGVIIVSIVIGFFFARALIEPVIRLNDLFKQMALGEVDFDLDEWAGFEAKYRDERGALMETFRKIVEKSRLHVDVIEALAKGDLSVGIEPQSERDQMSYWLNQIIEQLNLLYSEMRETGYQVTHYGNFNFKGDSRSLTGSYKDFIVGFNEGNGYLLSVIQVTSQAIEAIGQGIIPARITQDYNGDFNHIKDNINACIDGLGALVEGNEVLSHIVKNDFSYKVEGAYSGLYETITKSINYVIGQFEKIIIVINNIAQGKFIDLDRLKALGKFSEADTVIPSLIEMIETIQTLVEETREITNCAVAGDLSKRGDPSRFKGDYAKVIEGFNQTLNAVIEPINEATKALTELSNGNLNVEMNGDYRGESC